MKHVGLRHILLHNCNKKNNTFMSFMLPEKQIENRNWGWIKLEIGRVEWYEKKYKNCFSQENLTKIYQFYLSVRYLCCSLSDLVPAWLAALPQWTDWYHTAILYTAISLSLSLSLSILLSVFRGFGLLTSDSLQHWPSHNGCNGST